MISLNLLLSTYLAVFIIISALDVAIEVLNVKYLEKKGECIPEIFSGVIDQQDLIKINRYTVDKTWFNLIQMCWGKIVFLFIILSGILPWLVEQLSHLNFVVAGLIFFAVPGLISSLTSLPLDYYHSFFIEEKYGFNTKTMKIWVMDILKSFLLACILGSILLSLLLLMLRYAGSHWWIWAWLIFFAFQLLLTVLYPTIIAPLFNKFTPVQDSRLAEKIEELAETEDLQLKGIFQMDASKRSRHTNAYFSGLGKAKRIVLYDSLIEAHEDNEIIAILAHEIGHYKKNHIKKQLFVLSVTSILLFFLASKMMLWDQMFDAFGFSLMPAYVGLFLLGVLWEPIGFFLSPIGMAISRKFEREADDHCVKTLNTSEGLINAFKKMAKDNLSNLRPHPLYVLANYSHPPLLERIKRIETLERHP